MPTTSRARGFTLAESLIASVVLATAVLGLTSALVATDQQVVGNDVQFDSVALAGVLMEEIAARPFVAPSSNDHHGWTAGNTNKQSYDNVSDFNGYTDVVLAGAPNSPISLADMSKGFRRRVSFEYRNSPGGSAASDGSLGLITITVAPVGRSGDVYTLCRLVSRTTVVR
ncbi:MAG: type IV pilus modification PilV family protein [Tepidisphaeraceae bacterium]